MAQPPRYSSYLFIDKDPIIFEIWDLIQKEGLTLHQVYLKSNVSIATLESWFYGRTVRPQHPTVKAVIQSMGYTYRILDQMGAVMDSPSFQKLGPRLLPDAAAPSPPPALAKLPKLRRK